MSVVHVNIIYCYDHDYSFSLLHKPRFILVESVSGFEASIARQRLVDVLTCLNYTVEVGSVVPVYVFDYDFCTQF